MKRYLQILNFSWLSALTMAILTIILTFIIKILTNNNTNYIPTNNISIVMVFIAILIILIIFIADKYIKKQLKKLKTQNLIIKLQKYKTLYTRKIFCYVFICIVCFVVMLLNKQMIASVAIFDILALLLIIINKPSHIKVKFDLNLTNEELSKFNHIKFSTKTLKK